MKTFIVTGLVTNNVLTLVKIKKLMVVKKRTIISKINMIDCLYVKLHINAKTKAQAIKIAQDWALN